MLIQPTYLLLGIQKLALGVGYLVIVLTMGYCLIKILRIESLIESVHELGTSKAKDNTLLNITHFEFIESPKNICSRFPNGGSKNILNVIHSSRGNFRKRAVIRRTFGSIKIFRDWHIQTVFTLGTPLATEDESVADVLEIEIKKHGDIIIGNFIDTYHNLTYKHLAGYKWALEFCPLVNFYLKADDDMVVDIFHVIEYMSKNSSKNVANDYYCLMNAGKPERNPGFKWYITREEYPHDMFPSFCGMGVYITGIVTVKKILSVASIQDYIWMDDVFVTGVLRERANRKEKILMNFVGAKTHIFLDLDEGAENYIRKKDFICVLSTSGLRNSTCLIWNLVLEAHDLTDTIVSTCQTLY